MNINQKTAVLSLCLPLFSIAEELPLTWDGRLENLQSFVTTGLVVTSKERLPQTVKFVSDALAKLSKEKKSSQQHLSVDIQIRLFAIKLALLKHISAVRGWEAAPYDYHPDLSRLYKKLSVDATYYDAKQTDLSEIPDVLVRDELLRFREAKQRLINRSHQDLILFRVFQDKVKEVKRELHEMRINEPDKISRFEAQIVGSITDEKLLRGIGVNPENNK